MKENKLLKSLPKIILLNNHITRKILPKLGLMSKIRYVVPSHVLKLIYDTLILPHLTYGILALGYNVKKLYQLQKRGIRIINKSHYIAHT